MSKYERLTRRDGESIWVHQTQYTLKEITTLGAIIHRLAQYEDIGTPEEFSELAKAKAEGRLLVAPETGVGDLSDGYHTFNELYHHRAILFSVICNQNKNKAWKSKQHSDGTMFDGMFIVGLVTPAGQATYHYDIDPYWGMFDVVELEKAPEWDGHTSDDVVAILLYFGLRGDNHD